MTELRIEDVKKKPANFMYLWAENAFLAAIPKKYANIIYNKRLNQIYLINLSVQKYGRTFDEYKQAIYDAFVSAYGMKPTDALKRLAEGKTVAGKNWSQGVFGIGSTQLGFSQNSKVKVDATSGHILVNGQDMNTASSLNPNYAQNSIYDANGAFQLWYKDEAGNTYFSQRGSDGKYYASEYASADGTTQNANGSALSATEQATIWGAIISQVESIIQWLISLFGTGKETINEQNTFPSQTADGFASTSSDGTIEAGGLLLALAAGGLLLGGGLFGRKKKKK